MRITDFSSNVFSQYGEDGIIEHVLNIIGPGNKTCVEFGASDGLSCSNTANLWKNGWRAILIEADQNLAETAIANTQNHNVTVVNATIGPNNLDDLLWVDEVDYMSIDIDGPDYYVIKNMQIRPCLFSVEFNPTVPPHMNIVQKNFDGYFGASARALYELAQSKDYTFIGATYCNLFFVENDFALYFSGYDIDFNGYFNPEEYTYLISDMRGNTTAVGATPTWGINNISTEELTYPTFLPVRDADSIVKGMKKTHPDLLYLTADTWYNVGEQIPDSHVPEALTKLMRHRRDPICLSIDHVPADVDMSWIYDFAENEKYYAKIYDDQLIVLRFNHESSSSGGAG